MGAERNPEAAKRIKWMEGYEDGQRGWPPNRFMRGDADYMEGFTEGCEVGTT